MAIRLLCAIRVGNDTGGEIEEHESALGVQQFWFDCTHVSLVRSMALVLR
jgi:hypothetical protein